MPRTVKPAEERRLEIVEAARRLFFSQGYSKTTITEIIEEIDISKGLFYYYFGSKDDILDEVVTQLVDEDVQMLRKIAQDPDLEPGPKIQAMMRSHLWLVSAEDGHIAAHLRAIHNPELVIRTLRLGIVRLAPVFTEVIEQGISEGLFDIDEPNGIIEMLLYACTFEAVFGPSEGTETRARAFMTIVERSLGAAPGSLSA